MWVIERFAGWLPFTGLTGRIGDIAAFALILLPRSIRHEMKFGSAILGAGEAPRASGRGDQ
jgi:hypothetical protein